MTLYTHIEELLTFSGVVAKDGRRPREEDLGIIRDAAMIAGNRNNFTKGESRRSGDSQILWVGPRRQVRSALRTLAKTHTTSKVREVNLHAPTVMPAFIDCHTHLVFAGDRAHEFELRNQGATYQEIAAKGGGIRYTVQQTRETSTKQLVKLAEERLRRHLVQGVTTVEIKSGYGLCEHDEIRILEVIKRLKAKTTARIIATYLGPHAPPPGMNKDEYFREIVTSTLLKVKAKKLAERVDIFVEENYYSLTEAREYVKRAQELGFAVSAHADQLTRTGASRELAKLGAQSVDHCVQISNADVQDLAQSDAVSVLLPSSDFYLKMKYPSARMLIDAGARVALATDYNPGTSPTLDLSLIGVLARLEMRMSQPEVLSAWTYNAARALGLHHQIGALMSDFSADFVVLNENWRRLFYEVGYHPVKQTYCKGKPIRF